GDGGLAEGGDRVQVGARGEGGGDVGAVAVAGDDGAAHREGCWSWGRIGHGATSVIDAQGASSSENRAMWEALRWTSSSMPDTMRRVPSAVTDPCWADSGMGRGSGAHRTASRPVMKPRLASGGTRSGTSRVMWATRFSMRPVRGYTVVTGSAPSRSRVTRSRVYSKMILPVSPCTTSWGGRCSAAHRVTAIEIGTPVEERNRTHDVSSLSM